MKWTFWNVRGVIWQNHRRVILGYFVVTCLLPTESKIHNWKYKIWPKTKDFAISVKILNGTLIAFLFVVTNFFPKCEKIQNYNWMGLPFLFFMWILVGMNCHAKKNEIFIFHAMWIGFEIVRFGFWFAFWWPELSCQFF